MPIGAVAITGFYGVVNFVRRNTCINFLDFAISSQVVNVNDHIHVTARDFLYNQIKIFNHRNYLN